LTIFASFGGFTSFALIVLFPEQIHRFACMTFATGLCRDFDHL